MIFRIRLDWSKTILTSLASRPKASQHPEIFSLVYCVAFLYRSPRHCVVEGVQVRDLPRKTSTSTCCRHSLSKTPKRVPRAGTPLADTHPARNVLRTLYVVEPLAVRLLARKEYVRGRFVLKSSWGLALFSNRSCILFHVEVEFTRFYLCLISKSQNHFRFLSSLRLSLTGFTIFSA